LTFANQLLDEARANYRRTREIYDATGYSAAYPLNTFWASDNMRQLLSTIEESASPTEAIHRVDRTWMFSVNIPEPSVKERAVQWLLAEQRERGIDLTSLPEVFQESEFSEPANNVVLHGRRLTPDFIRCLNVAHEIETLCAFPGTRNMIVELGAGTGHLARVLRLLLGESTYVILDIPETLFFSSLFLQLNFPESKVLYVNDERRLPREQLQDYDFIFVPTQFADAILNGQFDLFVNTASMGEMRNEVIRYWMNYIQNTLSVRQLFTLNRFLNTIIAHGDMHAFRRAENEASVHYDSGWEILRWEVEPAFTRCPYIDTIIARYVEIVARRVGQDRLTGRHAEALASVAAVLDQDWVRLAETPAVMSARDNVLVGDMTMRGSLFALWNALRFKPDVACVGLLLRYLETLLHGNDREFEEVFYYEELFEQQARRESSPVVEQMLATIAAKRAWRARAHPAPPTYAPPVTGGRALSLPFEDSAAAEAPVLAEEGYRGFNIVRYRGSYYGLRQGLGPIDLASVSTSALQGLEAQRDCVVNPTLEGCRQRIDALA